MKLKIPKDCFYTVAVGLGESAFNIIDKCSSSAFTFVKVKAVLLHLSIFISAKCHLVLGQLREHRIEFIEKEDTN